MVTFLSVLFMVYTFRNLLGLLESAIMLRSSTCEINSQTSPAGLPVSLSSKNVKTFLYFISDATGVSQFFIGSDFSHNYLGRK